MIDKIVMPKARSGQNVQDTEARILNAAEHEFLTKGYAGARTTSIAEAAGVTHAMFHYYFRTKEKLFDRIVSEKTALLKSALLESVEDTSLSLREIIRNIIDRHLDFISANPDLPRFLTGEMLSDPERGAIFRERLKDFAPAIKAGLQEKIDAEAAKGTCRHMDAGMLMLDIVSLNVFAYMASPIINALLDDCMADAEAFIAMRKRENFDTIMRKLNP